MPKGTGQSWAPSQFYSSRGMPETDRETRLGSDVEPNFKSVLFVKLKDGAGKIAHWVKVAAAKHYC